MPNVDRHSGLRTLGIALTIALLSSGIGCRGAATPTVPDGIPAPQETRSEDATQAQAQLAFETGLRALDARQWEDAAAAFQWVVALDPGWSEARHHATVALAAAGFRDEAVEHARAYDAIETSEESLFLLGWALVGASRFAEARATFDARVSRRPADRLLLLQGWSALALGDLAAAQRAVDALRDPSPDAYCLAAAIADAFGDTAAAQSWLTRALEERPNHLAALRSLGLLLERTGQRDAAAPYLRAFLARAPNWDPDRAAVEAALERLH
jgi:tetratricopeptide (TPR) repeat protein